MADDRRFPEPDLPPFTRIVVTIDMVLCLFRGGLVLLAGLVLDWNRSDGLVIYGLALLLNFLVVLLTLGGGLATLRKQRRGITLYILSIVCVVLTLALTWVASAVPVQSHATTIRMIVTMAIVGWCVVLGAALRRAHCLYELMDHPENATRDDLWYLGEYPDFRELVLAHNEQLAAVDFAPIGKMQDLVHLDLSDTKITDAGVLELCELPRLETLVLDNTKVTEASLEYLAMLPALAHVSMEGTGCPPAALAAFHEGLEKKQVQRKAARGAKMSEVD